MHEIAKSTTQRRAAKFYNNGWHHKEIQQYLLSHYQVHVSTRTLKHWKKKLSALLWVGPMAPHPPIPAAKIIPTMLVKICNLRRKTGWGRIILKQVFPFDLSETSYRRIIKINGFSRGSKIENKRIHWVKWEREHPDSLWQIDSWKLPNGH